MSNNSIFFPLEDCIRRLKRISHSRKSPRDTANLFRAAVGFFCHLKKEQTLLYSKSKAGEECHLWTDTPAMTAVLSDPSLFMSLIRCLQAPPPDAETEMKRNNVRPTTTATIAPSKLTSALYNLPRSSNSVSTIRTAGRKRGLSVTSATEEPVSKVAKTNPIMSPSNQRPNTNPTDEKSSLPIQIVAASIFCVSLQHVNHWPAPLLHAYAEDAFGPRLWVDRKECEWLVANLRLSHDGEALQEQKTKNQQNVGKEAEKVANFYANMAASFTMEETDEEEEDEEVLSNPQRSSLTGSSCDVDLSHQGLTEDTLDPGDASDSGEEEVVDVGRAVKSTSHSGGDGDDSSSSGEEEVLAVESSFQKERKDGNAIRDLYPISLVKMNPEKIRMRYFGVNSDMGFMGITQALSTRLEVKAKQNSRLLQTLPEFCTVPGVRSIIASNLEKWLQSPALSGAARTLFFSTVLHLQDCDPPLPEDLDTIDAVLDMQLKANQLNVHIENLTQIAKQIPTRSVSRHIFLKLLKKELTSTDNSSQPTEHLKMLCAVHMAFTRAFSHDGFASAILTQLAEHSANSTRNEQNRFVWNIRTLLRRLLALLGASQFDACGLIEALLSISFQPSQWSARDEEDRGRIMLECMTLLVPNLSEDSGAVRGKNMKRFLKTNDYPNDLSAEDVSKLKRGLLAARTLLIKWSVMCYLPLRQDDIDTLSPTKNGKRRPIKSDVSFGAGTSDFTSVFDSDCSLTKDSSCPDVVKCVLFMMEPESVEMQEFLYPEGSIEHGEAAMTDDMFRVRQCYLHGADVDNKMISVILTAASIPQGGISVTLALSLIEHLFACCRVGREAEVLLTDPNLVWEMYKLAEFSPEHLATDNQFSPSRFNYEIDVDRNVPTENSDCPENRTDVRAKGFPRLARPGRWWRVTSLALVVVGASPTGIGASLCRENPTLCTLTKMVTSGRYRFPTVDCNDTMREDMKKGNSELKNLESIVAEFLFLPQAPIKDKVDVVKAPSSHGSRVSARQRQRIEDKLRDEREREAASILAYATKRKKMLKVAQKSIMVWDPRGPARKPPKESMNLIRGVERIFGLSQAFQRSEEPDLIQTAIGDTSRDAIERAYDWLIPVISSLPSVINRLPANASCFLLLKVYGTESEGDSKLRELSAPLLQHIRKTVTGAFGPTDAIGASNVLLADVADKNPARRRCARRVLEETLSELNLTVEDKSFAGAKCTWLHSLLLLEHIDALLPDAISHVSNALSHERGRVLRAFTLALKKYIDIAESRGIVGSWNFPLSMCNLLSRRQYVCSDALARFSDLRQLAISVVFEKFIKCLEPTDDGINDLESANDVKFTPCRSYRNGKLGSVRLPLSLLQSACVLLSVYEGKEATDNITTRLVEDLSNILMLPFDSPESLLLEADGVEGVASAIMVDSQDRAVSLDGWVMLAKSRSDNIARRAALSAPPKFLPRLLLCSGLPRSSLFTMIDRVGKLGEKSGGLDKVYRELLTPSATLEWGFGQIGTRREIARKLLGRLSAYISMSGDSLEKFADDFSVTFIGWLSEECRPPEKPRKGKSMRKGSKARECASSALKLVDAEQLLPTLMAHDDPPGSPLNNNTLSLCEFKASLNSVSTLPTPTSFAALQSFIEGCCAKSDSDTIESWMTSVLFAERYTPRFKRRKIEMNTEDYGKCDVALLLLDCSIKSVNLNPEWIRVVERWVPLLSSSERKPEFWKILFSHHESELNATCIVAACANTWCPFTSAACRDWILSNQDAWKVLDLQNAIFFLLQTSGQGSPHARSFQSEVTCDSSWCPKKEDVNSMVLLALECASVAGGVIVERNDSTGWLHLLLLVARSGTIQTNAMMQILLQNVEESKDSDHRTLIAQAILRVYCYYPNNVSLGNPSLRTLLVDASKSVDWRPWRTPIDETLNDMLAGVSASPTQRLVHALVDVSKSHPLMLLRKLEVMAFILEDDAMSRSAGPAARARFQADDIQGPVTGVWNGKDVSVVIRHWGYSFSDPLWVSFVEILLSVPREVLFSCGMTMGLEDLLLVYVKLLYVQSHLRSREKVSRLKSRFSDLIGVVGKDASTWNSWLSSKVPGLNAATTVRSVLVRCSIITADQAMETVRNRSS